MKNTLIILTVFACLTTKAQSYSKKSQSFLNSKLNQLQSANTSSVSNLYTFSTFTAPYAAITGTSLTNGQKWDDPDLAIPLGFNFNLYNKQSNTYTLYFGGQFISPDDFSNATAVSVAGAMMEDLCDRAFDMINDNEGDPGGISSISYETTGTPGNRICKIQVSNAAFFEELNLAANDTSTVNFQIWLYETTNDIEFRYGFVDIKNQNDNLSNGSLGFITGISNQIDLNTLVSSGGSNMLQGPSASPSVTTWSSNFDTYVSPNIANGRVYRFQRNTVSTSLTDNATMNSLQIFPNPAVKGSLLQIKALSGSINNLIITDLAGRKVTEKKPEGNSVVLNGIESGVYFVEMYSVNGFISKTKLVVID